MIKRKMIKRKTFYAKMIYTVLDTLLIIGALTVVATIDGGKWITTVAGYEPNFNDPKLYEPELYDSKLNGPQLYEPYPPAMDGSGVNSSAEDSTLVPSDCLVNPAPNMPEWFEINELLAPTSDCR